MLTLKASSSQSGDRVTKRSTIPTTSAPTARTTISMGADRSVAGSGTPVDGDSVVLTAVTIAAGLARTGPCRARPGRHVRAGPTPVSRVVQPVGAPRRGRPSARPKAPDVLTRVPLRRPGDLDGRPTAGRDHRGRTGRSHRRLPAHQGRRDPD